MESRPPTGATPLDPDEVEGLLHAHVTTRAELDELEEANIQIGLEWAMRRVITGGRRADVLSEEFLYALHQRMFGEIWSWAGHVAIRKEHRCRQADDSSRGEEPD
jgi:fido (protein-threonine AMPylation protein)